MQTERAQLAHTSSQHSSLSSSSAAAAAAVYKLFQACSVFSLVDIGFYCRSECTDTLTCIVHSEQILCPLQFRIHNNFTDNQFPSYSFVCDNEIINTVDTTGYFIAFIKLRYTRECNFKIAIASQANNIHKYKNTKKKIL